MSNKTFTMIEPDAVANGHTGAILDQIIKAGLPLKRLNGPGLPLPRPVNFMPFTKKGPFTASWLRL